MADSRAGNIATAIHDLSSDHHRVTMTSESEQFAAQFTQLLAMSGAGDKLDVPRLNIFTALLVHSLGGTKITAADVDYVKDNMPRWSGSGGSERARFVNAMGHGCAALC